MKVAFRADASTRIGTGHVMRCLTLANALRDRGTRCVFVCREHPGHLASRIRAGGHLVHLLPVGSDYAPAPSGSHGEWLGSSVEKDASDTTRALSGDVFDWLVVDHYTIDVRWETLLRPHVERVMVIDDLADREHDCDLLLDQNLGRCEDDYQKLVAESCHCLIGPDYALLRSEFLRLRETSLSRRQDAPGTQILVSMGGVDCNNVTSRVLDALATAELSLAARVLVVLGQHSPHADLVTSQASRMPFLCDVRKGVDDMAAIMAESDISIGAAGSSSWERCALGLPAVAVAVAENQLAIAAALGVAGAAIVLPALDAWTSDDLHAAIRRLSTMEGRAACSYAASRLVDGRGVSRVTAVMDSLR